ncbi:MULTISPECIES: GNAT family N-acetyltransferase [Microbacterium]|uniref:GNAT family N-acetyltransferase n=1 Tax=Microbacterium wangchenii TaxID=2541726 RepID=A0ABX5STG3_9MICO|nr:MULTISPECIES: GNAT family N-acetyltransferase [Microbacterium]MCK6066836.1 GNAT family N-acetyltransferase [Microbacterium sp. EYE_512]QBR88149.1 GNAT family N-acetyltransferase [Microbacterium wangchenii]TFV83729.1 GNAT family N-acetyltransferase [Microbacterium sp. dk485]TXK18061.1 GNAT family N-acetyltransferase [Microbacterium wangchenii]
MADVDAHSLPLDPTSAEQLAAENLEYALVANDGPGFEVFHSAVSRGFLDGEPTTEQIADSRVALSPRRLTGVFDRDAIHPEVPVGTVDSWVTELTSEPGRTVPVWAISGVTVAPTHRRRGIARAMLTGELRTAADAGFALAGLTVSEATIYGRWGFGPAVFTSDLTIDTRRVQWTGRRPQGRLDFLSQDELPDALAALHERTRRQRPGEAAGWPGLWRRMSGLRPGDDDARKVRAVAYRRTGEPDGILVYSVAEKGEDGSRQELRIRGLFTADDDAYAALWRFAIEHDLVGTVVATLQPADSPIRWMLSDHRAVRETRTDHHWLRILDVPRALGIRSYAAPLDLAVRVEDPLGFAEGTWRVAVGEDGNATVTPTEDAPEVTLGASALASILLGGVRPDALATAGGIDGDAVSVAALTRAFAPAVTPVLSIWY